MNRIDRLFGISTLLQSRKHISADKIADQFSISIRTVYRDIKALIEQGIPIGFEPNKGYFIVEGYFLPPISFNTDEVNALLLVEKLASGFSDRSIFNHYTTALNKVRSVLKPSELERLERMHGQIKFQMPQRLMYAFEHLSILQQAISSREVIEISYKNLKEELSCRKIECIGLIYYAFNWHVIAWCQTRSDYRDFNISRISSIKNTFNAFTKKDHIEVGDYMKLLPVDF
ncbi:MAG: YafY family transcriptional regulator [Chitinophagaceae bacterium]|nr:MAG: YafY family transcriptional regulator [Chitinophagaceae bacterium]